MDSWSQLTVYTTTEGLEMVGAFLLEHGVNGLMIEDSADFEHFLNDTEIYWDYVDESLMSLRNCETAIKFYLPNNPQGSDSLAAIRSGLEGLRSLIDLELGRLELVMDTVHEEDWANEWKKYYHPTEIGNKFLICPSWEDYVPSSDRIVLTLDPGMAFGTGTHSSTKLCLELLESSIHPGDTMLDVGCGSGILAIASLLLGAKSAVGVDIDELATKIALDNATLNHVENKLITRKGDLTSVVSGTFDVICANIVADVILRLCPDIPRFLNPGGTFITSGIIDTRKDDVLASMKNNGIAVKEIKEENGWVAIRGSL